MFLPLDTTSALSPAHSAVVEACAGSGKTWLLVLADDAPVSEFLHERRVPETRGGSDSILHTDHIGLPALPVIFLPSITGDHSWKQHP